MSKKNLHNKAVHASCPVLGFVAFSGTGKTTLLKQVISKLKKRGIRLGIIKHAHHDFDIDIPGKDSYELRKSGAEQTLVASRYRWALVNENNTHETDPVLETLIKQLNTEELDLVLVEGFKHSAFPKVELHRASLGKPLLYPEDDHIIAIATDTELVQSPSIKTLGLNQPDEIVDFIFDYLKLE